MTLVETLLLAAVQGFTEFLPISSSGHLVLIEELLGIGQENADVRTQINVALHFGTLCAVFVIYFREIWKSILKDHRVISLVIVGTFPAALIGVIVDLYFEEWLASPLLAGAMLIVTGSILLFGMPEKTDGDLQYEEITYKQALLIGLAQAVAILPGISRSGVTIIAGIAVGMQRKSAATFSFLLAIPVILGASVLKLVPKIAEITTNLNGNNDAFYLILGMIASFLFGIVALWWLLKWLEQGRLQYFAYWCFLVGSLTILWKI